jgi:hypothetical protein
MELDPGMHIGLHLVCFSKTRCDNYNSSIFLNQIKFKMPVIQIIEKNRDYFISTHVSDVNCDFSPTFV